MTNSQSWIYERLGEPVPAETFPLELFWVCTFRNDPISPCFRTKAEAEKARDVLLAQNPDAGVCGNVRFL